MITTTQGQAAELAVAKQLNSQGYKILDRNWKTKICEIDIVAQKGRIVYFVEAKYRVQPNQGSGLEYITAKKLDRLKFAAKIWCQNHDWDGDYRLLGAEVTGLEFDQIDITEID